MTGMLLKSHLMKTIVIRSNITIPEQFLKPPPAAHVMKAYHTDLLCNQLVVLNRLTLTFFNSKRFSGIHLR